MPRTARFITTTQCYFGQTRNNPFSAECLFHTKSRTTNSLFAKLCDKIAHRILKIYFIFIFGRKRKNACGVQCSRNLANEVITLNTSKRKPGTVRTYPLLINTEQKTKVISFKLNRYKVDGISFQAVHVLGYMRPILNKYVATITTFNNAAKVTSSAFNQSSGIQNSRCLSYRSRWMNIVFVISGMLRTYRMQPSVTLCRKMTFNIHECNRRKNYLNCKKI